MDFIQVPQRPDLQEQWLLVCARFNEWLHGGVFSLQWWVLLALMIITVFLWCKIVDKSRLNEMALYTAIIIMFIIVLDELGQELSLWFYNVDLTFLFPPTTAINISCMPLVYMVLYQYFKTWKSFIVATVVMSTVFCFVFEPIFVWGGVYTMLTWKSYYGFPIYIFIALISKFIVQLVWSISAKGKLANGK